MGLRKCDKIRAAKRKLDLMTEKHQEVFREEFDIDMEPSTSNCLQISERNKIEQFNTLLSLMREKLLKESTTLSEKNQILTMVPSEWSIRKISEFFNVSYYTARESIKLRSEKGFMASPESNHGKPLSKEIEDSVKAFYQDDEHTKLRPQSIPAEKANSM